MAYHDKTELQAVLKKDVIMLSTTFEFLFSVASFLFKIIGHGHQLHILLFSIITYTELQHV